MLEYSGECLCLKVSTFNARTGVCRDPETSYSKADFLIDEFSIANLVPNGDKAVFRIVSLS